MRIGIDIRATQNHHQYRGIGVYCLALLSSLANIDHKNEYVLFFDINLPDNVTKVLSKTNMKFVLADVSSQVKKRNKLSKLITFYSYDVSAYSLDMVVQPDMFAGIPKGATKNIVVAYDLIPLIFKKQYFNQRRWITRKKYFFRYMKGLRSIKNYSKTITISQSTKNDLITYRLSKQDKVHTILLGYAANNIQAAGDAPSIVAEKKKYLLYVGSCDYRKNVIATIEAFEIAKSKGLVDSLVLVGIDFIDAPPAELKRKLTSTSGIVLTGYVDDKTLAGIYKNAEAFVFPSLYEGFGLPILESFSYDCPVISYKNSSLHEVGGDAVIYAENPNEIVAGVASLQADKALRSKLIAAGHKRLESFDWDLTASNTLKLMEDL